MKYVWIPPDYANHQLELPPSIAPNVHVHPRTSQPIDRPDLRAQARQASGESK